MKRFSKHIIIVLVFLLTMSFSLLAQDELTPVTTLLDQAQSALEDDDLSTAQSLLVEASALITPELETTCDTLPGAKALLDQAASAEDVATATSLLTSAEILIATCSETASDEEDATSDPLQAALTPVVRNADWTPVERDFDGVTMVLVPAGCFDMGSENGGDDEQPVHEICFDEPFWIDKYEVTNEQYGSVRCSDWSSEPDQPRNCVTWSQASDHCEARSARLPTEAEWEYAARGPDSLAYPWGNEFDGTLANHCDSNCRFDWASNFDDGFEVASPVGSFPDGASWVGAHDMSGNLWEWTSSLHEVYPYDEADGREDPDNRSPVRVVRGGSFHGTSLSLRGAARSWSYPSSGNDNVGFRCVRPPSLVAGR